MSDCVFCKIARREILAEIVWEFDGWMAFRDVNPQAPVHLLVIPTDHWPSLTWQDEFDGVRVAPAVNDLGRRVALIAHMVGLTDYRMVMNNGRGAGQQVPHLHVHLLGGWEPGKAPPLVPSSGATDAM